MKPRAICLLFAVSAFASGQSAKVDDTLSARARSERLAHAPTDDRIRAAEHTLASAPGNMAVEIDLVAAYLQKVRESGDFSYLDRASKIVDKILEQDSSSPAAAHFQNEMDMQRHKFAAVAERARSMTKYDVSDAAAWANLGDASMELGQYPQAGDAYVRMFALQPDLASYNRVAYFRFVSGDAAGAIALMQTAIQAGSPMVENTAWCWAELGDMYFKTGRVADADAAYRSALRIFPRLHRAIAGLGRVQAAQGHPAEAIKSYQRAQSIVPLVDYAGALEDLYRQTGRPGKAAEQRGLLDAIDTLARTNKEMTNRNLALIFADHDRNLPRALEMIQAELPGRGDVYTWDAAAWIYLKSGRLAEARAASAKALKLNTPEPLFYYHASQIARAAGDPAAATTYADRCMALNPHFDTRDFHQTDAVTLTVIKQ